LVEKGWEKKTRGGFGESKGGEGGARPLIKEKTPKEEGRGQQSCQGHEKRNKNHKSPFINGKKKGGRWSAAELLRGLERKRVRGSLKSSRKKGRRKSPQSFH